MPKRDPDEIVRGSIQEPPDFEDLWERRALELTSSMRFTGRPHFSLWQDRIGGAHFREDNGLYVPIFCLFESDVAGRIADEARPATPCWFRPRSHEARGALAGTEAGW